jgi:hypothetical protein
VDLEPGKFYQDALSKIVAFGAHQFKGTKQIGGGTVNDHLAALERKGRRPKMVEPELPPGTAHIWNTFVQLSAARTGNGFGANPLPYGEIEAFCRLTRTDLEPWEIDVIRALDLEFLAAAKD